MCHFCFDVLVQELRKSNNRKSFGLNDRLKNFHRSSSLSGTSASSGSSTPPFADSLPHASIECPLFITWEKQSSSSRNKNDFELRGCIGTLSPKPLLTSIGEYALISALRDKRFRPVVWDELPALRVAVSLLVQYEECADCHDWSVGVHGIIIKFYASDAAAADDTSTSVLTTSSLSPRGMELSATFLPEVAAQQGWDQRKAVDSLIRKAGYKGHITEGLLRKIRCTRYQSSKHKVTFDEYLQNYHGQQQPGDPSKFIISDGSDTDSTGSQSKCRLM